MIILRRTTTLTVERVVDKPQREWGKWRVKCDTWQRQETNAAETPHAGSVFPKRYKIIEQVAHL